EAEWGAESGCRSDLRGILVENSQGRIECKWLGPQTPEKQRQPQADRFETAFPALRVEFRSLATTAASSRSIARSRPLLSTASLHNGLEFRQSTGANRPARSAGIPRSSHRMRSPMLLPAR